MDLRAHSNDIRLRFAVDLIACGGRGNGLLRKFRPPAQDAWGTSPAVAAGIEFERWDLERVVEMTADYMRRKDDAVFEEGFAEALGK